VYSVNIIIITISSALFKIRTTINKKLVNMITVVIYIKKMHFQSKRVKNGAARLVVSSMQQVVQSENARSSQAA